MKFALNKVLFFLLPLLLMSMVLYWSWSFLYVSNLSLPHILISFWSNLFYYDMQYNVFFFEWVNLNYWYLMFSLLGFAYCLSLVICSYLPIIHYLMFMFNAYVYYLLFINQFHFLYPLHVLIFHMPIIIVNESTIWCEENCYSIWN